MSIFEYDNSLHTLIALIYSVSIFHCIHFYFHEKDHISSKKYFQGCHYNIKETAFIENTWKYRGRNFF